MTTDQAARTPKGTPADLRAIAKVVDPDASPEAAKKLAADINGIAIYFLMESRLATDTRGVREERERYEDIARSAHSLWLALNTTAMPGVLLGPLAKLRGEKHTDHREEHAIPSNVDTAYAVCWPWGKDAHPLYFIEQVAREAAAELARNAGGAGPASLHARLRGHPRTALALACARLLNDVMREPPKISEKGPLANLMALVWKYATGTDAPPGLGFHARKGAAALRNELGARRAT